jgi:hypothetical protein
VVCWVEEGTQAMALMLHRFAERYGANNLDRGAAAVEFALVAMLLLTLVFGIAEFGRMWYLQSSLAAAARDGARTMAVENDAAAAEDQAEAVFVGGDLTTTVIGPSTGCESGLDATASLTYEAEFMTGFFDPILGDSVTLSGKGVMRCGG